MAAPAVGILVLIHPAFAYPVAHPGFGTLIAVQIVCAFLMTGYFAGLPALLSRVFPVQTRTTGMSLAYNVGVTIFGGFGPFIIAWLIRAAGMKTAPSFYVMFAAVLSLAARPCCAGGSGFGEAEQGGAHKQKGRFERTGLFRLPRQRRAYTCAPAFGSSGSCASFFSLIRSSRLMPSHIASEPATNTDE